MDYANFELYPLNILGVDESYNDELNAIADAVVYEMEYTGAVGDVESVLPYFVFFKFCEQRSSEVTAPVGEQGKVTEFSGNAYLAQIRAWNIGVKKLTAICTEKVQTVNENYLSKISVI